MPQTQGFRNNPSINTASGASAANDGKIRRYVHSPLTVEHNGINASIKENGRVVLSHVVGSNKETGEIEYDEVEVPASLIFKMSTLLRATRKLVYVSISEIDKTSGDEASEQ